VIELASTGRAAKNDPSGTLRCPGKVVHDSGGLNREGGRVTQVDEGPESPGTPGVLTFGTPTVGEVLAERYELQEHINDDAFGRQVWRGVDVILRRPVAVVMRYPGGEAAVEMLDAAVAASRVVHPHLVDVYDAIDETTRAYVVREWVDGGSLREYVAEAPLDPDRATTVASAIASAVAAIHATGMAHGNIHAGTVLIGSDGRVVLSDARADESATPDADVRAVGAVLYCSLTGHWPHAEAGASSLPDAVRDDAGTLAPLRQVRGGIPGHLSDLATDLLDPTVAPPSADVLAADLSRLEGEQEEAFFSVGSPLDFDQPNYPATAIAEPRRSVRKLIVGVAVLLVLSLAGLLLTVKALSGPRAGATSTTPSAGGVSTTGAVPNLKPIPIAANQVRVVDPPNGDRRELAGAAKTVDNDPSTAWASNHYKGRPDFGGIKPGMGILINLGSPKQIASVQVIASQGATIELRTGTSDPGADSGAAGDKQIYESFTLVGQPKEAGATRTVFNGPQEPVQYLLVWISKLPPQPDSGGYQVQIQDIQIVAS